MFLVVLLADGNRGLVLPTLAGYIHKFGGGSRKLALANAGFSAGRLMVAPWLGYWMDCRPIGEVLVFTLAVGLVANLCYVLADAVGTAVGDHIALWCIVLSRSVLGVGACVLGVGRAYVSKHTTRSRRTAVISLLCAAQYFGFTAFSGISLFQHEGALAALGLNSYTFPGATLCLLYAALLAAVWFVPSNFWDSPDMFVASPQSPPAYGTAAGPEAAVVPILLEDASPAHLHLALTFVLLNFTVRAILATQETLGTCAVHYLYNGENVCHQKTLAMVAEEVKNVMHAVILPADTGALVFVSGFFTMVGFLGMIVFLGLYHFSRYLQDRAILLSGLAFTTLGLAMMLDPADGSGPPHEASLLRFGAGFYVAWAVGYPLTQTVVVSALSKVLPPHQVGRWMGYQASAGSAGRVVGPLLAGYVYQAYHENDGFLPFAACFLCALLCTGLVAASWPRLDPQCL